MRLSLWPNAQKPWSDIRAVVTHADATGWHAAYIADHFMGDGGTFGTETTPTFEATALIAALGGATDQIRLGSLVLSASYRHAAVLANWASTTDHVTNGRLTLGLGAGWQQNEHDQYDIELLAPRERVDKLVETIEIVKALTSQTRTSFHGQFYTLNNAVNEPKPVQQPLPFLIGGKGNRMLSVAAKYASIWNMWANVDVMAERMSYLRAACERIDRDPTAIDISTQAFVFVTDSRAEADTFRAQMSPRPVLAGSIQEIAYHLHQWQDFGLDEFIVPDWHMGPAEQVIDHLDALREAMNQ